MSGLFTFDGPMFCDSNGVYCNTTITNEMLSRYYVVIDNLCLLMRTFHLNMTYEEAHLHKLEIGERLKIIELPNLNTIGNYIRSYKYQKLIAEQVNKADMIFLRIPSIISNMVAKECIRQRKPYLAEVGGCAWDSYWNHGILGKIVAPSLYYRQKYSVREAAFVSYVTNNWLQKRYPTNGESIVASNVYLTRFDDMNIECRVLEDKQHPHRRYRLGTIASVDVRYKGQESVIRAIGRLKRKGMVLDYDLVGAGNPTYLKNIAKKEDVVEQVHFLGVKLHEDIWTWLDTVDIYAQPSKQEGLPRAVIEAMSRGCMTIGSDVAGIPELLESDMVFRRDDIGQICKILERLVDIQDHERFIRRNFEKSREFKIELLNERRTQLFMRYKQIIED